ncbi:MAG: carbon starvation CstA family protein [Planctomycetota bacterium]
MSLLLVVMLTAAVLLLAYLSYGRLLTRLLRLDPQQPTPAVELRDDLDYVPIDRKFLLGQHFSAIAAAGPIVGPILAGRMFGWLPALLWILVGAVFIGGVHDLAALTASIRHKARSIAEVVREHMTRRSYVLFLAFIWLALVYIIVAFADITASSFVGVQDLTTEQRVTAADAGAAGATVPQTPLPQVEAAGGDAAGRDAAGRDAAGSDARATGERLIVRGGGIATSSLLYLALPLVMGVLLRYTRLSLGLATVIFLPLVGVAIWVGQYIPLDVAQLLNVSDQSAQKIWAVGLLAYCYVASIIPMWLLLQPRGHLGGWFLYAALLSAALGLIFGGQSVAFPAFKAWETDKGGLVPLLFITIACGACSGFHSLVASGTTSKQLKRETDARLIGYGAMLMEGMVAVVSLCCVMMLAGDSPLLKKSPNFLYANGIGSFLGVIGIPAIFGVSFGLMAFTTFVYDTLDVCTRLGRYVVEELTGWRGRFGRLFATAVTAGAPVFFLVQNPRKVGDAAEPVWRTFWDLFGASNQLLAALTLIGVTVWLWRTRRARWVWFVTGLPAVWMYVVSVWALVGLIQVNLARGFAGLPAGEALSAAALASGLGRAGLVPWISLVLVALAALMLVEAARVFLIRARPPQTPAPLAMAT